MKNLRLALGIASTMTLAACGAGEPTSKAAAEPDSAQLAEVVKEYDDAVANTAPDIALEPLSGPAPTGKTLEIITCAVPICALYTEGAEEAAEALGWETKTVVAPFTPEGFKETWDTVLQDGPDAVVMAAVVPTETVIDQVQQAADEGIVVVGYGLDVPAGGDSPFVFGTTSPDALSVDGRHQGLAIIEDAEGPADVLVVAVPAQVNNKAQVEATTEVLESVGSEVQSIEVDSAGIGKTVPAQIVTHLQAHPDVEYVVLPNDDFVPGVPQALQSAGLGDVKLIGEAVSDESAPLIENGQLFASTVHPVLINGWYLVDAIVRTMTGDPIDDPNPMWESAIVTKDNLAELGDLRDWPHIQDEFTTAWNVG